MSKARIAGTRFEVAVRDFLRDNGHPNAERCALEGRLDRGDIRGIPNWVLECKSYKSIDLAGGMKEAAKEAQNAGVWRFAAVFKKRNASVAEAYCVIPLYLLAELMRESD